MVSWLRPRRSAITFDLGAAGIRACQFQRRGNEPRLCDALQFDRSPSADAEQTQETSTSPPGPSQLDGVQLDRLIGQGRFTGREVSLVLSPPEVQFFPLRLPEQALAQPPARIQQALKWEVARESRHSADDLQLRHWRLPHADEQNARAPTQHANIMAVVMPSELARQWCDLFERHRLTLCRIDVSPCALVRSSRCIWTPVEDELWGVLDLGLRHSTLTIVVGTAPTYIRSLSVSAPQWTRQLAEAFEVSHPIAEQLKREHGVQPTPRGLRTAAPGRDLLHAADLPSACASVLRDSLQTLAHEVARCFSYVMQSFPNHAVKALLLAGGGGRLRGLPAVLEAELGIPVTLLATSTVHDTPQSIIPNPQTPTPHFGPCDAASLGGALLDLETS